MFILPLALSCMAMQSGPKLQVKVDPGMELVALTLWLSGRYAAPTDSTYKLEVWNSFRKFKHHPAIEALRSAKQIYPDFTELGIELSGWPNVRRLPNPNQDKRWIGFLGQDRFDEYFRALPDFVQTSGFWTFFRKHQSEYTKTCGEFTALAEKKKVAASLDQFFRYGAARPRPRFEIYLEFLNGWGAHAITSDEQVVDSSGESVVRYQLGYLETDKSSLDEPVSYVTANGTADVAWHEGSHVYVAPLFARYRSEFPKLERLFNKEALASQNISTWEYCLNENTVRAIAAVLIRQARGDKAYEREWKEQVERRGFIYTRIIADLIWDEYLTNAKYSNFDEFFPRILGKLSTLP